MEELRRSSGTVAEAPLKGCLRIDDNTKLHCRKILFDTPSLSLKKKIDVMAKPEDDKVSKSKLNVLAICDANKAMEDEAGEQRNGVPRTDDVSENPNHSEFRDFSIDFNGYENALR
ncbi:unnamed protein product [Ilex paraguariensis]|uniref:Uncharacterized protein n=1 Tax=Ilex paraguariensis TaxID=185542 RepID=A0ABC8UQG4_9AQUA